MTVAGPDLAPVRLVIDNGQPAPVGGPPEEPPPATPEEPQERDVWLPPDCPVKPLGKTGQYVHLLDERDQYVVVHDKDLGRAVIEGLFGRQAGKLDQWFPRWRGEGRDAKIVGWRPEAAGRALKVAAARRPLFDPLEAIRGAGAWRGEAGELVLHVGDAVLCAGEARAPGQIGRWVYPASAALPRPDDDLERSRTAGREVLRLLRSWHWRRQRDSSAGLEADVDALLMLGWICSAKLGAALDWRSMCWVTGDAATGKSTLLVDLVGGLFGLGLLRTSDASAAGIWQTLGHSVLPVAFDELEAQEDPKRAQAIIHLARQAASGNQIMRGSADHKATQFTARSSFLFSSILIPPLLNQDRSRLAILELEELAAGGAAPDLAPAKMLALGRALMRRLVDGWPEFGVRLKAWREGLIGVGHGGRGADQFGTLLACADLALHEKPATVETIEAVCAQLTAAEMAERDDAAADHARCLQHLLSSTLEVYRGGAQSTVAEWIRDARRQPGFNDGYAPAEAEKALGNYGLKVYRDGQAEWLAVANAHQGLARLFSGTHWAARSGASGVWMQALRRLAGASNHGCLKFNGVASRATLVPIASVVSAGEGEGK